MKTMKALVYERPGRENGSIKETAYPVCSDTQMIIKVISCGICKPAETSHDKKGSVLGRYPAIPGHEFSGIVEEVGCAVTKFKPGDRVTADNGVPCGKCYFCQKGQPAFCVSFGSMGHNLPGGMAQFISVEESAAFSIPDNVSFNAAALCELIGCCLHCVERSCIRYGDNVAILGCGSSGMVLAQLVRHSHAGRVVVLDSVQSKLDRIAPYGVETVWVDRTDSTRHETVLRDMFPYGVDIIIDTTGYAPLIDRSLNLVKCGGRFVGYSFPTGETRKVEIDMAAFIIKELSYIGSTFQSYSFQRCLDALETGKVNTDPVITHEYAFDDYFSALDMNVDAPDSVKVIIHPNEKTRL